MSGRLGVVDLPYLEALDRSIVVHNHPANICRPNPFPRDLRTQVSNPGTPDTPLIMGGGPPSLERPVFRSIGHRSPVTVDRSKRFSGSIGCGSVGNVTEVCEGCDMDLRRRYMGYFRLEDTLSASS